MLWQLVSAVVPLFTENKNKNIQVVDFDALILDLSDRVIVYSGEASVEATAAAPESLLTGLGSHHSSSYIYI